MHARSQVLAILTAMACLSGAPLAAAQTSSAELARQVGLMEDREEIRALLIEYARALDNRDFETYGKLFARDGEWKGSFGVTSTPEGIQASMEKTFSELDLSIYENSFHIVSNDVITVNGDTATAFSRWTWVVAGADGKPTPRRAGHYVDTLTREDGKWKFKSREAVTDIIARSDTNDTLKKKK